METPTWNLKISLMILIHRGSVNIPVGYLHRPGEAAAGEVQFLEEMGGNHRLDVKIANEFGDIEEQPNNQTTKFQFGISR